MLLSRLREQDKWLTAEDVFYMGTRGGSDVLNRTDIGQISEGKQADLNLMSMDKVEYSGALHDPLAALVFSVSMQPFDYVIVNGNIVVKEGKIPHVDEKGLIKQHQELSEKIISNAAKKTKEGYGRS